MPSKRQRRGWSKGGVLGDPWQEHPPGQEGSTTFYPAGTAARIVAIQRVRGSSRRRIETLRFELWWSGEEVERAAIHEALTRGVARSSESVARLYRKHEDDPAAFADAFERDLRKNFGKPRAAPWRLILARLHFKQEDLFSFANLIAQLAAGGSVERDEFRPSGGERTREEIFASVLGLDRVRLAPADTGGQADSSPIDAIAVFEELQAAGILDPTHLPAHIREADDRELDLARDRARVLVEKLGAAVTATEVLYGRDPFGLGYLAALFRTRMLLQIRNQVLLAFLLVAHALPADEIDQLIEIATARAAGAIALGEFVRRYPHSKDAMKRLARSGPEALGASETRRIQEEMTELLAERPELQAQFESK